LKLLRHQGVPQANGSGAFIYTRLKNRCSLVLQMFIYKIGTAANEIQKDDAKHHRRYSIE
jgi:hypothetical protein